MKGVDNGSGLEEDEVRMLARMKLERLVREAGECCRPGLAEGGVVEVYSGGELKRMLEGCRAVVAFFYTPTCPYCRMLRPVFEELADAYGRRAGFAAVNLARMPFMSDALAILGTPTIILFLGGREVGRLVGLQPPERLAVAVERLLREAGC